MKKIVNKQGATLLMLLQFLFILSSCSDDSYLNVIPENSTALVAIDAMKLAETNGNADETANKLKAIIGIDDAKNCGIDFTQKLYIFETADGNIGFAAKVSDEGDLNDTFNAMAKSGKCQKTTERKGFSFTVINGSWVAGFSSDALLILGPVLPTQYSEVRQQIVKMLNQDSEQSIKETPMFDQLDSINSSIAIVAQASALPDKFIAPFTLGAPKDADASQIVIAASLEPSAEGCLEIKGETFSFNKAINAALKESQKTFRPIEGRYLQSMSADAAIGSFMNVDGKKLIQLLHTNKSFMALLAGLNTAIDIDNIIKSVDGDLAFIVPSLNEGAMSVQMSAQLGDKGFLNDVDYWKQSCPKGSKITDWEKDSYCFTNGNTQCYFGVSADMQYFSGSTPDGAKRSITSAVNPLPTAICNKIKGQRLCMVLNINAIISDKATSDMVSNILNPLFGDVKTILYCVK